MNVKVLGPGCGRCKTLALFTEQALMELGIQCTVEKVTDLQEMMAFGVLTTPALVVDGQVKLAGKVPAMDELKRILQQS